MLRGYFGVRFMKQVIYIYTHIFSAAPFVCSLQIITKGKKFYTIASKRDQINELLVRYGHIIPVGAVAFCFLVATVVSIARYATIG
eukprot:gene6174-4452_t